MGELQQFFEDTVFPNMALPRICMQVQQSNKIVVFTGAGISTACGIPDFRGPSGIWTLQRAKKPIPKFKVSFGVAMPSLTHQVGLNYLFGHTGLHTPELAWHDATHALVYHVQILPLRFAALLVCYPESAAWTNKAN